MKIRNISLVVLVSIMLFGCGSSKQPVVTNAALDAMMEQETFQIMVTSAEPQVTSAMAKVASSVIMGAGNTVSRIDLTGQGYFIKLEDRSSCFAKKKEITCYLRTRQHAHLKTDYISND